MNCHECREELVAYVEHLLDDAARTSVESHLAECSSCEAELCVMRTVMGALAIDARNSAPVSLETVVMDRILQEQAIQLRRLKMRRRIRLLGISGAMVAAILMLLVSSFWFAQPASAEKTPAEVLAQGADAVLDPKTVHIVAKMRTLPNDNFSMIGAKYDFVPVEIWEQFGETPKWRVQKPGRVAVMDGLSTTMLIRPNYVVRFPKPSHGAFDTGWLLALANVQDMITHELRAAQARGWDMKLTHEPTGAGEKMMLVTVEAKSGLPADDYLKNKFFEDSDMRRVYRFDAKSKRLESFDAYLHEPKGNVLILSIKHIEYNKPLSQEVFALKLPEKIVVFHEPQRLPDNEKYEKMTPDQAARAFFEACGRRDWDEVGKFMWPLDDRVKSYLGGLELVHLGTPFQSKGYPGWYVPYEIKLGFHAKSRDLIVRNDNPAKHYVVCFGAAEKLIGGVKENEKYAKMSPKEVVQAFLDAYGRGDTDAVNELVIDVAPIKIPTSEAHRRAFAAGKVGEPILDRKTGYWRVPVEYQGTTQGTTQTKKYNLAVRSDNPAHRYVVDGGI